MKPPAELYLSDADVVAICERLSPTWKVPLGAMKWALGAVGIETPSLPDGTAPLGFPPADPIKEKEE